MNCPCLVFVNVAVLSDTAFKRVFREGDVGQIFETSDAHNTGAFNASHVPHKPSVENTHRPGVEDSPPGGLCHIDRGSQIQGRARTSIFITHYMNALRNLKALFVSQ